MKQSISASTRAAAWPVAGLFLTYLLCALTPWGRQLESLSTHGRIGTGWSVRHADLFLLAAISTASVLLALVALVVVGGVRGRWRLALRNTVAVVGSLASAELLKHLLPSKSYWTGDWRWLSTGSFPSGHAVIVTSISLAVLSVSSTRWRRWLVGPLVACTAITTTATVTVGWHRPGDVIGSFFLATAWHRAMTASRPAEHRLRAMLPSPRPPRHAVHRESTAPLPVTPPAQLGTAAAWWLTASAPVLGSALEGVLSRTAAPGRTASLAYLVSLAVVLAGALIAVTNSTMNLRRRPARVPGPPAVPEHRTRA